MKLISIHTEYITLGQLLKFVNIASSGGDIKAILSSVEIKVDGELEQRRGKKLYKGMKVEIKDFGAFLID